MIKRYFTPYIKPYMKSAVFLLLAVCGLAACSTNPATGEKQFTALMSPAQEQRIGNEENQQVLKEMGAYDDPKLQAYVSKVGQSLAQNTERPDVSYKFTVVDSPMVNAFALPGGYVYVTRGLLALANNEAELAAVLGHEIGHITARHAAERYSQTMLATLGTAALSLALDKPQVTKMAGLGSELYLKSYSRGQENEADTLGIRYLYKDSYDPHAMARFLNNLDRNSKLEAQIEGRNGDGFDYFSTHPRTSDRFAKVAQEAEAYPAHSYKPLGSYLDEINGMVYGDSARQGFLKGRQFYHPGMGFTFEIPQGYQLYNGQNQIVVKQKQGDALFIFDAAGRANNISAVQYVRDVWMKKDDSTKPLSVQPITMNGMSAATAFFNGTINNKAMIVRVIAVEWSPQQFLRFQIAIPQNAGKETLDGLKRATYSLRPMTAQEKQTVKPYHISIITAQKGDTVQSLAARMALRDGYEAERFRVLNGMKNGEQVMPNFRYKIIAD